MLLFPLTSLNTKYLIKNQKLETYSSITALCISSLGVTRVTNLNKIEQNSGGIVNNNIKNTNMSLGICFIKAEQKGAGTVY